MAELDAMYLPSIESQKRGNGTVQLQIQGHHARIHEYEGNAFIHESILRKSMHERNGGAMWGRGNGGKSTTIL